MMKPLRPCPVFAARSILDAWGKPGGGLSGLFGDIYDAPTLGGWVIVQYDIPATDQHGHRPECSAGELGVASGRQLSASCKGVYFHDP